MNFFVTPELLYKYIDGQCTDEEIFMLFQWYDSFEDQDDPLDGMSEQEQQVLKMLMLEKFRASIKASNTEEAEYTPRKLPVKLIYALSGIAALLLLVGGLYFKKSGSQTSADSMISTTSEMMVLTNKTTSIYKQVLSDGSVVWLSPKSELQYPKKFMGIYRQVKMNGEAFFEVSKNHSHPFIVYSGGVVTRVWGTSFRISSANEVSTEVSVMTGKVSVKLAEKDDAEMMLYPSQKAVFTSADHSLVRSTENARSIMRMWGKVSLSFDNVPLNNVLAMLRNKYGMHIYTDDRVLGKYLLKADFTDQSLPAILEMLQNSLNAGYTIDDTQIVLYRKTN
jgi:transmembrane sensor